MNCFYIFSLAFFALLCILSVGTIVALFFRSSKDAENDTVADDNEPVESDADADISEEYDSLDIKTVDVTVLTLRCGVKMEGIKQPKTVRNFLVTFLTDDGEKLEFSVEEEFYTSLNEGERGSLALLNGAIYDYVSDTE